jgi:hypothetical protein
MLNAWHTFREAKEAFGAGSKRYCRRKKQFWYHIRYLMGVPNPARIEAAHPGPIGVPNPVPLRVLGRYRVRVRLRLPRCASPFHLSINLLSIIYLFFILFTNPASSLAGTSCLMPDRGCPRRMEREGKLRGLDIPSRRCRPRAVPALRLELDTGGPS